MQYLKLIDYALRQQHTSACMLLGASITRDKLAFNIITKVLAVATEKLDLHPDVWLSNVGNATTNSLTIEGVREIIAFLQTVPTVAAKKIVYIADVGELKLAASNALLKTLEEIPDYALILLGASNTDLVLPTIVSRCLRLQADILLAQDVPISSEIDASVSKIATDLYSCFVEGRLGLLDLVSQWLKLEAKQLGANLFCLLSMLLKSKNNVADSTSREIQGLAASCTKRKLWAILKSIERFNQDLLANKNLNLQLELMNILLAWGNYGRAEFR